MDAAGNVAYRLALNTLRPVSTCSCSTRPPSAAELADAEAIRALAHAVADRDPETARTRAADLLERSLP